MANFIKVESIEQNESDEFTLSITDKLIRESDIESVERFISEDEDIDGALIKFYDGDYIIVQNYIDDIHNMLED